MQLRSLFVAVVTLTGALAAPPKDSPQDVLARMDQAAASFQAMTAKTAWVTHTDVINENATEYANVVMRKSGPNQVEGLIEFTEPANSSRTFSFSGNKAEIYYPKIKTVEVYDLGKNGEQIEQFILIGFGISGTELAKSYDLRVLPSEPLHGEATIRLELVPKSEEVRKKYVSKIEMWIPDHNAPYPLQEKTYEPSGDYHLITYTDVRINPPLKADAVKLKVPAGVKTVYPQK